MEPKQNHHKKKDKDKRHTQQYAIPSEPISLVKLLDRQAKEAKTRNYKKPSCDKRQRRHSNIDMTHDGNKKLLRFATNPSNGNVWSLIQQYDPEPPECDNYLWWSADQMHDRYEADMDLVDRVEEDYLDALYPAYHPKDRSSETVDLNANDMYSCSVARGLEVEIMTEIATNVKAHRNAVLRTQAVVLQEMEEFADNEYVDDDDDSEGGTATGPSRPFIDSEMKLIRWQSLK